MTSDDCADKNIITTMRNLMLAICLLGLSICGWQDKSTQAEEIEPGMVYEQIYCKGNEIYSYACYLPKDYSPKSKYPILYCFSPIGNGQLFVQYYQEICEYVNWIVICSNDSKNGPVLEEAIEAMWKDTHKRFSINDDRVYVSGMSGGSRTATWFGSVHKIKGHIAIGGVMYGNGLLSNIQHWWLMCGDSDFNRPEMEKAEKELKKKSRKVTLKIFEGGHTMPSEDITKEAILWMEKLWDDEQKGKIKKR